MPEPGAVLRVCCLTCGVETENHAEYAGKWYCRSCQKQARRDYLLRKAGEEIQRHELEKDFHARKMKELQEKLSAVEGES